MTEYPFFTEILIVLFVATVTAFIFDRLRMSAILGFLLAGVIIGPKGFGLLADTERIRMLAELGMILLMFSIGLEFSFEHLRGLKKVAILGGGFQISVSILITLLVTRLLNIPMIEGFVIGAVIALSSTAIVIKHLIDRAQLDTHQGRVAVSILVFQDLAVVPLVILISAFGTSPDLPLREILAALLKAAALVSILLLLSRFVFLRFIHWVAMSRNREIFFLTAVVLTFGAAWLSHLWGLSMAIGAFFAGLVFANTDYGHQIAGEISSFRHVFVSLFFVSIGLLFNPIFALEHIVIVSSVVVAVLLINILVTAGAVFICGYPLRISVAVGIMLAQMGEFSFLLLEAGRHSNAISPFLYETVLSSAFLTMLLTPFLIGLVSRMRGVFEKVPCMRSGRAVQVIGDVHKARLDGHVILCGFGMVGKDIAASFEEESIPFIILEMNPAKIHEAKKAGFPVLYGDAANEEVLRKAGIEKARAVTVSFGDFIGMSQVVGLVERLNPHVLLVVRTRFERDVPGLYELGADVVVMEELEASIELSRVLLEHFYVGPERRDKYLNRIRSRRELIIEEAIFKRAKGG